MNNKFLLFVLFLVFSNYLCAKTTLPAPTLLLNLNNQATSFLHEVMVMHKFENLVKSKISTTNNSDLNNLAILITGGWNQQNTNNIEILKNDAHGNTLNHTDTKLASLTTGYLYADITNHASPISKSSIWYTKNNTTILPVNLIVFNAQKINNTIVISWNTTQEINSSYFTVQHSTDGNNWTIIANKSAAGTSNSSINYQVTDNAPITGNNYYRLLQVDKNGTSTLSSIVNTVIGQNRSDLVLTLSDLQQVYKTVLISWNTINGFNDINNFIVQRSSNGNNWTNIATTIATGTNSRSINYKIIDNAPSTGNNYYRIMLIYKNGTTIFSTIKTILFGANRGRLITHNPANNLTTALNPAIDFTITPNPANGFTTISFPRGYNALALNKLSVLNTSGVSIKEIVTQEQNYKLNTSSFSKGIYFIKVLNGNNLTTQKLLIL